jgi:radical SAM superfamily enzyme YgiQ (UPF0313 family)
MLPQQPDTLAIIDLCKSRGIPVCVGGPGPTSTPDVFRKADFLVIGEAESVIDDFIAAFESGARGGEFVAPKFQADVSKSPVPRFDLLDMSQYMYVGVQFSRGCPFRCEFCDIIELYGNVPRAKTTEQMLRELEALHALDYRGQVDFVDDNLIGNKKALKKFLPVLIAWQKERNYPFKFSTEASINLADDSELLQMMRQANFFAVFVGIETPDNDTLVQTQKKQNARRSLADGIAKIYEAGMFVLGGFIVGFDAEQGSVSQGLIDCIDDTAIPISIVGLLTALPNTQLTRRLEREGRLLHNFDYAADAPGDQCTQGLNFTTLRARRDILEDYRRVLAAVYAPAAFFRRCRNMGLALNRPSLSRKKKISSPARRRAIRRDLGQLVGLIARLAWHQPRSLPHFVHTFLTVSRKNPAALEIVITNIAFYLHLGPFSRFVIRDIDRKIRDLEAGDRSALPVQELRAA